MQRKKESNRQSFNQEQYNLLMECSAKHDMTAWNTFRAENPEQPILLRNACLEKAYLRGADLHKADLSGASLRGTDLSGEKRADFSRKWADLSEADMSRADLCETDFRGANLSGANFSQAYLFYTNLSWTNLSGANFNKADLWAMLYEATLVSVDLDQAHRRLYQFTRVGSKYENQKLAAPILRVLRPNSGEKFMPKQQSDITPETALTLAV
jgi:hypothetical protein